MTTYRKHRFLAISLPVRQVKYLYYQQCHTSRLLSDLWLLQLINLLTHATWTHFHERFFVCNWNSYKSLFPCKSIPVIQIVSTLAHDSSQFHLIQNSMQTEFVKWAPETNWLAFDPIQHSKSMTNTQNNKEIRVYSLGDEVRNPKFIALVAFDQHCFHLTKH